MTKVATSIFREYDIRGIAGEKFEDKALREYEKWYGPFPGINISPEVAVALGRAYGTIIKEKGGKKIVIGHERRPYGEELKMQFAHGVLSSGLDVYDAGETLTPMIYFATTFYDYDGGVNVTGSHNVYFFNGFKMMGKNVFPVYGEDIQRMRHMIENESYAERMEDGKYEKVEVFADYEKYLLEHCSLKRKLKVVVDCGNGSAGLYAPDILTKLGCEVVEMYTDPDPSFPNHIPDPEDPYVMQELQKKVIEEKADVGFGIDADGDRCGTVDEKGSFVHADLMLLLLSQDILARNPGKKVLYDVKCTRLLEDFIPKYGGVPVMHVTGHAPIKATLRTDEDTIFAGEISGHFFFVEDYFKIDDGLYAMGKILALLASSGKTLSELLGQYPKTVITPELKLPCEDQVKFDVVDKIREHFSKKYKTVEIDGVRIIFSDKSWGLVRASNTSPYLTIRIEADTEEEVIKIKNILADELEKFPEIANKLDREHAFTHTGRLGWV